MDMTNEDFVRKFYTENSHHTHVNMMAPRGKYLFDRNGMEELFDRLGNNNDTGLAEKPQSCSMLVVDIDYAETSKSLKSLYTLDDVVQNIINPITEFLSKHIENYENKHSDCVILTKEPYISKDKVKHGLHLAYINTFLQKEDYTKFETSMKSVIEGFDCIQKKPWLMYGSRKNDISGKYKAESVYTTANNFFMEVNTYFDFNDYEIYDSQERKIEFTKDIDFYLPRILSIIPYNRSPCEFKNVFDPISSLSKEKDICWDDQGDEISSYKDTITEVIEEYIGDDFLIKNWNGNFLSLNRMVSSPCPAFGNREHDNLGAYITINKNSGTVLIGCYCNETNKDGKKMKKIGNYKTVKSNPKTLSKIQDCISGEHSHLAELFMEIYGSNISIKDQKTMDFYHWNEKSLLWEIEPANVFPRLLNNILSPHILESANECYMKISETEDKVEKKMYEERFKAFQKLMKNLTSTPFLNNVSKYYSSFPIDVNFEKNTNNVISELPIQDGYLFDLSTCTQRKRTKNDFYTFELDVSFVESEFTNAISFFSSICRGDQELIDYHQKFWGYCLTGEVSDRSLHVAWGTGRNGKSTLVDLIKRILGPYITALADSAVMKQDKKSGATPELMPLLIARTAVINETEKDQELNSVRIKALTGSDDISARELYGKQITFRPKAKMIMLTNNKPTFDITDMAMCDRIKLLPFLAKFEETNDNKTYVDNLSKFHLNEIFSWLAIGAYRWYQDRQLSPCSVMKLEMDKYKSEIDIVGEFVRGSYDILSEDDYKLVSKLDKKECRIPREAVFQEFSAYGDSKIGRKEFFKNLDGFLYKIKVKGYFYYALKTKSNDDDEEDDEEDKEDDNENRAGPPM